MSGSSQKSSHRITIIDVISLIGNLKGVDANETSIKNRLKLLLEKKFQIPYTKVKTATSIHTFGLSSSELLIYSKFI